VDDGLLYRDLAAALAVGLLIGVERGWRVRDEASGTRVAGFRTFALLGGLGGIVGLLSKSFHPLVPAFLLGGVVSVLVIATSRAMTGPDSVSATMFVASLVTLGLAMLATSGFPALAVAGAAVTTLILSMRTELHGFLKRLGKKDVQALARFSIIAGAILPFLPDREFGPYDAWNPQQLWLVVVLVTGLSFLGYIANHLVGARHGTIVTAVIGGLYSSTAVTAALSQRLRHDAENSQILSAGIALASAIMFLRTLALTAIVARFALVPLLFVIGPAIAIALLAGLLLFGRSQGETSAEDLASTNPIELLPALGFLLLVALMAVVARWAEERYGGQGVAILLLIVGSVDVDAATVTLGGLPRGLVGPDRAGLVLAGPLLANTLVKTSVVVLYAGWNKGRAAIFSLLAAAIAVAGAIAMRLM
jgi:uncharacterized membrane protein (DUF4010 family)